MKSKDKSYEPFDIYVRHSGDKNVLFIHGCPGTQEETVAERLEGKPLAFLELSVLPEWITDERYRAAYKESGRTLHLRIPIHSGDLPTRSGC